jgi:choline dehydrogenase-like flavoprotein
MQRAVDVADVVDVVIVGSGVCGSLVAARLASTGVKVLILEAGPRVTRPDALAQYHAAPIKIPECPYPNAAYAPHSRSDQPDSYYLQNGPDKFESTYLRQVGGTTWHWLGTTLRFVPDDFRLRSKFGVALDWPITYDDLELGAGRRAALAVPRSAVDIRHRIAARRRLARGPRVVPHPDRQPRVGVAGGDAGSHSAGAHRARTTRRGPGSRARRSQLA